MHFPQHAYCCIHYSLLSNQIWCSVATNRTLDILLQARRVRGTNWVCISAQFGKPLIGYIVCLCLLCWGFAARRCNVNESMSTKWFYNQHDRPHQGPPLRLETQALVTRVTGVAHLRDIGPPSWHAGETLTQTTVQKPSSHAGACVLSSIDKVPRISRWARHTNNYLYISMKHTARSSASRRKSGYFPLCLCLTSNWKHCKQVHSFTAFLRFIPPFRFPGLPHCLGLSAHLGVRTGSEDSKPTRHWGVQKLPDAMDASVFEGLKLIFTAEEL